MKNRLKVLLILFTVAALAMFVCVGCDHKPEQRPEQYTMTFVADGAAAIDPITASAGESITAPADPSKPNFEFVGWYETPECSGEPVTIPTVMPDHDVTYYAKFEPTGSETPDDPNTSGIIYEYNLTASHDGNVASVAGKPGDTVEVKDGADYLAEGYKFVGWTDSQTGTVSLSSTKNPGQYNAGESVTLGETSLVLYAQWAREFVDGRGNNDAFKLYIYEPLIESGLGAAILERDGQPDKLGFVETTDEGFVEFQFYFDEAEGGDIVGRIYDDYTYLMYDAAEAGIYVRYDYVTGEYVNDILALDGYNYATESQVSGDYTAVRKFGLYGYDDEYGDYTFLYMLNDGGDELYEQYFTFEKTEIESSDFDGYYIVQGDESGTFFEYGNGELSDDYYAMLNGYGYMQLYMYNLEEDDYELYAEGTYRGTDEYYSAYGEWELVSSIHGFKFILGFVNTSDGQRPIPIYIMFDADLYGEFACGADSLYLDGYGDALYTAAGEEYSGECTVSGNLVTFVPYIETPNGTVAGGTMYFNIDRTNSTFAINTAGFKYSDTDETVIEDYFGTAQMIAVPEGVTGIADDAFNYGKSESGVSLVSVTLPTTLTTLGARAFQNNYTLSRVIFTAENPITIDWSSANSPFRWPSGNFIIVVPQERVDVYKAAWSDCPYKIMGSVDVTIIPVFETDENGVLIRYNKPDDAGDAIDVVIPDEITEIGAGVFRGMTYIRSVDLNNVTTIGESAFDGCVNLVSVVFRNVQTIGDHAFFDCAVLRTSYGADGDNATLELPAVVTLGEYAFGCCTGLRLVRLGADIESIGSFAFYECQVYESGPPLFVELTGTAAPTMGERITVGNLSFRFKVPNIAFVESCIAESTWVSYFTHLYIESGAEKGLYAYGDILLDIDGRAMYQSSDVWQYGIDGNDITFYAYDSADKEYNTYRGTIDGDTIAVDMNGKTYTFVRVTSGETHTYTSADGKYTLVLDPTEFTENVIDVVFNGTATKMSGGLSATKTITNFVDADGETYNFSITFDGDTITCKRSLPPHYVYNIKTEDGSVINLHYTSTAVYVYGKLMIEVDTDADGEPVYLPEWGDNGTIATVDGNTFTFTRRYGNFAVYNITVTVSDDQKTFTYTYTES